MMTYGKMRRFKSFSSLFQPGDAPPKPKKEKKKGAMVPAIPAHHQSNEGSYRDGSIEELASMLLDNTTADHLAPEPAGQLAQTPQALPGPGMFLHSKTMPQLPGPLYNGDDARATKKASVVTSASSSNMADFDDAPAEDSNSDTGNHYTKPSAPSIPRKSSKRRSSRPNAYLSETNATRNSTLKSSISAPMIIQPRSELPSSDGLDVGIDVNAKIAAMLEATDKLKGTQRGIITPNDGTVLHGPLPPKRRLGLPNSKSMAKLKTVINEHFPGRVVKNRESFSVQHEHLLEPSFNDSQDNEDELDSSPPANHTLELRMNEGNNFAAYPKLSKVTGHGRIRRKPVTDDGKSLKSLTDNSLSRPPSRSMTQTPSSVYSRPTSRNTPSGYDTRSRGDIALDEEEDDFVPDVPALPLRTPAKSFRQSVKPDGDFDSLLSSSPFSQSTPRIRLEPTIEEDGSRTLRNVPAESRSLFDSDSSSNHPNTGAVHNKSHRTLVASPDSMKRKSSQIREDPRLAGTDSKRMKKHPSPSKEQLEHLEAVLREFPPGGNDDDDASSSTVNPLITSNALAPKDANQQSRQPKHPYFQSELTKKSGSMSDLRDRNRLRKSMMVPVPTKTTSRLGQYLSRKDVAESSMMDLDELQWDDDAYYIGRKRA